MPRASRYFLPGYIWHLTHRCHKRQFLLKFNKDRQRYLRWLFEAKKRYGLTILNYMVTSNHVHLLVESGTEESTIPRCLQLVAGRVAQEFNCRKNRTGAFWEDRYHATAIESGEHLARCMIYINFNMVRAGAVNNPFEWKDCGLHEIRRSPRRYRCIDLKRTAQLLGLSSASALSNWNIESLEQAGKWAVRRDQSWSESIAVGTESFVCDIQAQLRGGREGVSSREVKKSPDGDMFMLREWAAGYDLDEKQRRPRDPLKQIDNRLELDI